MIRLRLVTLALPALVTTAPSWAQGCTGGVERREGLDPSSLPADVRDDYTVFAQRCSKCHSLARPLESGITDDAFWREYVARMRRQPGSGITEADTTPILRFLHWYSVTRKEHDGG